MLHIKPSIFAVHRLHTIYPLLRHLLTTILCLFLLQAQAQSVADFENILVEKDSFLNGSEGTGSFSSGPVVLDNDYNEMWAAWTGWAISSKTDTLSPGFANQYSAISGAGADNSTNYAVSFVSGASIIRLKEESLDSKIEGLYVTNNAYAYWSMKEGDAFAKKFGGVTGHDPDFFLLTIKKYREGLPGTDSVNFYLADFRSENDTEDYILKTWAYIDLSPLGEADSLLFTLSSSDVGAFGMNTPAYFCVDHISVLDENPSATAQPAPLSFGIYPNPAVGQITVAGDELSAGLYSIFDVLGRRISGGLIKKASQNIDIQHLIAGKYFLRIEIDGQVATRVFIKA